MNDLTTKIQLENNDNEEPKTYTIFVKVVSGKIIHWYLNFSAATPQGHRRPMNLWERDLEKCRLTIVHLQECNHDYTQWYIIQHGEL